MGYQEASEALRDRVRLGHSIFETQNNLHKVRVALGELQVGGNRVAVNQARQEQRGQRSVLAEQIVELGLAEQAYKEASSDLTPIERIKLMY